MITKINDLPFIKQFEANDACNEFVVQQKKKLLEICSIDWNNCKNPYIKIHRRKKKKLIEFMITFKFDIVSWWNQMEFEHSMEKLMFNKPTLSYLIE